MKHMIFFFRTSQTYLVYKIVDTRQHLLLLEQMTIESNNPSYERYKSSVRWCMLL